MGRRGPLRRDVVSTGDFMIATVVAVARRGSVEILGSDTASLLPCVGCGGGSIESDSR